VSDLFCLYVAKDVVAKHLRPAEKLIFRARQLDTGTELEFDKMQCANEIGQLKQSVARRPDGVCELHVSPNASLKHLVKHTRDRRLPTIIKWRDENPATHAESFPRIPVTPAIRRRSIGIVAHSRTARKGVR